MCAGSSQGLLHDMLVDNDPSGAEIPHCVVKRREEEGRLQEENMGTEPKRPHREGLSAGSCKRHKLLKPQSPARKEASSDKQTHAQGGETEHVALRGSPLGRVIPAGQEPQARRGHHWLPQRPASGRHQGRGSQRLPRSPARGGLGSGAPEQNRVQSTK